jgi:hypothetical protein
MKKIKTKGLSAASYEPAKTSLRGRRCLIPGCANRTNQGLFIGRLCYPCYSYLIENKGIHSQAYRNELVKSSFRAFACLKIRQWAGARLSDAQFAEAAKAEPGFALSSERACARLTDAQFAEAAKARPWAAQEHEWACARLTDAQFAEASKAEPRAALSYEWACARLTDAQFAEAAKEEPGFALVDPDHA